MERTPLSWQDWWDNIAMSGFAGSVVGGIATGAAVAATLWWQRRSEVRAELRRTLAACRAAAGAAQVASLYELHGKVNASEFWRVHINPVVDELWAVSASAATAGSKKLQANVEEMLDELLSFESSDPRLAVEHAAFVCGQARVHVQMWLIEDDDKAYDRSATPLGRHPQLAALKSEAAPTGDDDDEPGSE